MKRQKSNGSGIYKFPLDRCLWSTKIGGFLVAADMTALAVVSRENNNVITRPLTDMLQNGAPPHRVTLSMRHAAQIPKIPYDVWNRNRGIEIQIRGNGPLVFGMRFPTVKARTTIVFVNCRDPGEVNKVFQGMLSLCPVIANLVLWNTPIRAAVFLPVKRLFAIGPEFVTGRFERVKKLHLCGANSLFGPDEHNEKVRRVYVYFPQQLPSVLDAMYEGRLRSITYLFLVLKHHHDILEYEKLAHLLGKEALPTLNHVVLKCPSAMAVSEANCNENTDPRIRAYAEAANQLSLRLQDQGDPEPYEEGADGPERSQQSAFIVSIQFSESLN